MGYYGGVKLRSANKGKRKRDPKSKRLWTKIPQPDTTCEDVIVKRKKNGVWTTETKPCLGAELKRIEDGKAAGVDANWGVELNHLQYYTEIQEGWPTTCA